MSPLSLPLLVSALVLTVAVATPLEELRQRCGGRRDAKDCLMSSLASYVDGLADSGGDVDLWSGLRLRKVAESRLLEQRDGDVDVEDDQEVAGSSESLLGRVLVDKLWGVAQRRALVWNVAHGVEVRVAPAADGAGVTLSLTETDTQDAEEETGRRRRRRRRGGLSLLLAAMALKLSAFGGVLLKGVALLVGKALLVSKLALLVTLVAWAAKLGANSRKRHVTYEVVSHPQKVEHASGEVVYPSHPPTGWGRSSHDLVYSAHIPNPQQLQGSGQQQ